jgi:hypothetical protein
MARYVEWDIDNPVHRRPRRRPSPPIDGRPPRIRVEVVHRYQPRRHSAPPAWIVPLVFIAALAFFSPYALIIAIVMGSILIAAHPTFAFVVGGMIALVIIIAIRERWHGRSF